MWDSAKFTASWLSFTQYPFLSGSPVRASSAPSEPSCEQGRLSSVSCSHSICVPRALDQSPRSSNCTVTCSTPMFSVGFLGWETHLQRPKGLVSLNTTTHTKPRPTPYPQHTLTIILLILGRLWSRSFRHLALCIQFPTGAGKSASSSCQHYAHPKRK